MVNPHDKTVLARDLQLPEEEGDAPILDGEIVVPDFDQVVEPELERLSIPELERISIPALHQEQAPSPRLPPQTALPKVDGIPSLPAGPPQASLVTPGRRPVAASAGPSLEPGRSLTPAPRSNPKSKPGPIEFDDDFETFEAGGLSDVQSQLIETVQTHDRPQEAPWPTGNSPDYSSILIDPIDARVHANFGPSPQSPLRTPEYAIKVFKRRREIKAELAAAKVRCLAAEDRRDQSLAALAQACRKLEGDERFRHFFTNLETLEQLAKDRSHALAGDNQQYAAEVAKADQVIAANQARSDAVQAELAKRSQKLAEEQQLLTRAEAQYKRLLIEIRSLKNAEEDGAVKGKPVDHSARITALMGQVQAHQAMVSKRTADRSAAQAHVDAARKELERYAEEDRRLKKQKDEFDKSFQQRLGVRSQGVQEAQKEMLAEGARTGRALLGQRGGIAIPETVLSAVRSGDADVLTELKAQRMLEVAINEHDHISYHQGRNFIIASVVILLLLIAMKVLGSRNDDSSGDTSSDSEDAAAAWEMSQFYA